MSTDGPPGWNEWGNHVLEELKRLNENMEKHGEESTKFEIWVNREIATLKVKASVWGVAGGAGVLLIMAIFEKWSNH